MLRRDPGSGVDLELPHLCRMPILVLPYPKRFLLRVLAGPANKTLGLIYNLLHGFFDFGRGLVNLTFRLEILIAGQGSGGFFQSTLQFVGL
jgi:hypothetical protein